jgi:hypothetical protein
MLAAAGNSNELVKEIKNIGHNWDPMEFPEWLLLEVESGLMIRDVQEKIAAPMRDSANNSCMQLNMVSFAINFLYTVFENLPPPVSICLVIMIGNVVSIFQDYVFGSDLKIF